MAFGGNNDGFYNFLHDLNGDGNVDILEQAIMTDYEMKLMHEDDEEEFDSFDFEGDDELEENEENEKLYYTNKSEMERIKNETHNLIIDTETILIEQLIRDINNEMDGIEDPEKPERLKAMLGLTGEIKKLIDLMNNSED